MAQTDAIKNHLRAIHDEIQSAAQKEEAGAKEQVRTAMSRLDAVKEQIKGDITQDNAIRKGQAEEMLAKIQKANDDGKNALNASGEAMREKVQSMQKNVKSAMEST